MIIELRHVSHLLFLCGAGLQVILVHLIAQEDCSSTVMYGGCSESKERLRIQPSQLFHCTRSVIWCIQ